jgi:predicted nucleotidyltransferase
MLFIFAPNDIMIDETTIARAVELLQAAAPQATVMVFGSYARGNANEASDLDLLAIEPRLGARRMEAARLRTVLRPLGVPVDLLVVSEETFKEWSETPGMIVYLPAQEAKPFLTIDFGMHIWRGFPSQWVPR